jgi:SlyX protein
MRMMGRERKKRGDNEMESRLIELEIKVAFQEDLLEDLNTTVAGQQRQLMLLQDQIRALYQQITTSNAGAAGGERNLRDEIPPHY